MTDPDEYLEIAKKIGYENLEPSQQQYVIQLEQAKQMEEAGEVTWDILKGAGVGLYDVGKDTVTGLWDFITDPGKRCQHWGMQYFILLKHMMLLKRQLKSRIKRIW